MSEYKWNRAVVILLLLSITTSARMSALERVGAVNSKGFSAYHDEAMNYTLKFKGLNVADSRLYLEARSDSIVIHWEVKTRALANALFNIDNHYKTVVHSDGRLLEAVKIVQQKNISDSLEINYDHARQIAHTNKNYSWPVVPECQNMLSMLYDLRTRELADSDTIEYILDVESQVWRAIGVVQEEKNGGIQITFSFLPYLEIVPRAWKTDLVTNRLASRTSTLLIRLGPQPLRQPLFLKFGGRGQSVEMKHVRRK